MPKTKALIKKSRADFNKALNQADVDQVIAKFSGMEGTEIFKMIVGTAHKKYSYFLTKPWRRTRWKNNKHYALDCSYCEQRTFPLKFYVKSGGIWHWYGCDQCVEGDL